MHRHQKLHEFWSDTLISVAWSRKVTQIWYGKKRLAPSSSLKTKKICVPVRLNFGCELTQIIMGCQWLCHCGVNYKCMLFHFHLKIILQLPLTMKSSWARWAQNSAWKVRCSCGSKPVIQTSRGAKANVLKPTNNPSSRTQQINEWLKTWIFEKKHKTEELISQNTSKHTKWSAQRGWRQLDTSIAHWGRADKWTQVNCIKVKLGIRC